MASSSDAFRRSRRGPGYRHKDLDLAGTPAVPTVRDRDLGRRWSEGGLLLAGDAVAVYAGCAAVTTASLALLCSAFAMAVLASAGLLRSRLSLLVLDDLPRLLLVGGVALSLVFATAPLWDGAVRVADRRVAGTLAVATLMFGPAMRFVFGCGFTAKRVARALGH